MADVPRYLEGAREGYWTTHTYHDMDWDRGGCGKHLLRWLARVLSDGLLNSAISSAIFGLGTPVAALGPL